MNKYFINITKNLNSKAPVINTTDDIQCLTKSCENHISIRKIREANLKKQHQKFFILNQCLWMTLKKQSEI